jgi:hypothetical protein
MQRPEVVALGYFGSYARGDWGGGSDLDSIAVVTETGKPFERRSAGWDLHIPSTVAQLDGNCHFSTKFVALSVKVTGQEKVLNHIRMYYRLDNFGVEDGFDLVRCLQASCWIFPIRDDGTGPGGHRGSIKTRSFERLCTLGQQ